MSGPSPSLDLNPELERWLRIEPDGTVVVCPGKVEIGQGIGTALAHIAADELDVPVERIRLEPVDTDHSPNEFVTAGSMSIQHGGMAVRQAAAEARRQLLERAAERLGQPAAHLRVENGVVYGGETGPEVSFAELCRDEPLSGPIGAAARPKRPEARSLVGHAAGRIDLADKVFGAPRFIADLELEGMLHARVVRPPRPGATLLEVDLDRVRALAGVVGVVRDGSFLAVVCAREELALAAMTALERVARWSDGEPLPDTDAVGDRLEQLELEALLVESGTPTATPVPEIEDPPDASVTREATYDRPYQMHASLAPSAAAAELDAAGRLSVWSHTQGPYVLRGALAEVLEMPEELVRVRHVEGAGCYGHNGADDAALDAALVALAVPTRPVLLQWTREQEHTWEPYGSAMRLRLRASLDSQGRLLDWNQDVYSHTHVGRPRPNSEGSGLLAAWHREHPRARPPARAIPLPHVGIHRNADPLYTTPRRRIVKHLADHGPLRTSSLRGLGAYANIFAIESFLDELAVAGGVDPVQIRLRHLDDPRARAVVEAAADRFGWRADTPNETGTGRGIGFARYKNAACYAAVIVELRVDDTSAGIQLERAVIAADAGEIIDPDGLVNQLEGGLIQSASWTLHEQVRLGPGGIESRDWDSYPILRFGETPEIDSVLLDHPELPALGAGEATQGPTAGAIANAIFHATGLRLRRIPFTRERLREAARLGRS